MSDDLFSQDPVESGSLVEQLVGEGKKFATIEDLAKGKLEADKFIEQLETENKLTREQMIEVEAAKDKQATIAELIQTVKDANKQDPEGNNQMSEEDLSKKIRDILQGEKVLSTREANRQRAVQAVLDKMKGDVEAAKSYVAEQGKKLGMSVEDLRTLSETSPDAFHRLMETNPSTVATQGITSIQGVSQPTGTSPHIVDGHRTKAYYNALKKEMGTAKYWQDSKIQGQYTQDAVALGSRFNQ
jgi:hypothetical protein